MLENATVKYFFGYANVLMDFVTVMMLVTLLLLSRELLG
jgi:hypothetical protein